jgi:hypothetical protein
VTRAKLDGLQLMFLGVALFLIMGAVMELVSPSGLADFKQVYYGAKCVLQQRDPYNPSELEKVYAAETGNQSTNRDFSLPLRLVIFICTNLPSTLLFAAALTVLPWKLAAVTWTIIIAGSFIIACFLAWSFAAESSPRIAGFLIFLLMANSELLMATGNTAGLVVSLSVIAVWCFLRERFVWAGIVCLAAGLVIKPHDSGLIWLYFFLAGGIHRKRALHTLVAAGAFALLAALWVAHGAPHWAQELHANLLTSTSRGGRDDPGPASGGGRGIGMIISLQAIVSQFRDDPSFYNPIVYLICGALVLIWSIGALRSRFSSRSAWFALAAIAALSMLPVYHRSYDARLLALTVPACAMLWRKGGPIAWCALLLNLMGILVTGDLFWIVLFHYIGFSPPALAMAMVPAPLILLAMGMFYLWVYMRLGDALPANEEQRGALQSTASSLS